MGSERPDEFLEDAKYFLRVTYSSTLKNFLKRLISNPLKSIRLKYLRPYISRPCKKLFDNVNATLERVGSEYRFTAVYQQKPTSRIKEIQTLLEQKIP